jgi:c(7)-type cytochrome triheme protein
VTQLPRPQPIRAIALRHRTCVQLAVQLLLVAYPVMALSGCGAEFQERIVTTFFDDVKAPPPKRKLRADISRENEQLKAELAEAKRLLAEKDSGKAAEAESPAAEKAKSWPEVAKLLPKVGESPDWTAAIKANIIAPRPGIDPKDPEQAPLDLDLELATSSNRLYFAFFPHDAHTQWLSCGNCHPSIYPLKQQGEPAVMTMAKISAGESCGVCHGTVAFSTTACVRCHPSVDGK